MPTEAKSIARKPLLIDLALQGGGSHGAFTWGVLDRLLEEPWLTIDGISGTSAGAMNAAVLVYGHQKGGAAGAREALEAFWRRVSDAAVSVRSSAGRSMCCSGAGRSILRRSMS
jgi:NTE family protein